MALNAYLILKGAKLGAINGGVTEKGKENSIEVHSFNVEIDSPRDATTGLPTGKRQHDPLVIVKVLDKSSPLLWQALVTNENLTQFVLQFWNSVPVQTGVGTGADTMVYTITLTNASIASIRQFMADNEIPANASLPVREEISFTYQKITWTWVQGGITATDDWSSPTS